MAIKGSRAERGHVTPHLIVRGGDRAIDFYRRGFGAVLLYRSELPHGAGIHAHMRAWQTLIMITDEATDERARQPDAPLSPESLGGSTVMLETYVENVDDTFARALDAGATAVKEPWDAFYGDRCAYIKDPFGHLWSLMTTFEELTPDQVAERMQDMMAEKEQARDHEEH
ncbi:MAG: VOC family protein [Gemmatimonadota bacterium]|nr:VOC family protein [Gemmatimonadota bacterium]